METKRCQMDQWRCRGPVEPEILLNGANCLAGFMDTVWITPRFVFCWMLCVGYDSYRLPLSIVAHRGVIAIITVDEIEGRWRTMRFRISVMGVTIKNVLWSQWAPFCPPRSMTVFHRIGECKWRGKAARDSCTPYFSRVGGCLSGRLRPRRIWECPHMSANSTLRYPRRRTLLAPPIYRDAGLETIVHTTIVHAAMSLFLRRYRRHGRRWLFANEPTVSSLSCAAFPCFLSRRPRLAFKWQKGLVRKPPDPVPPLICARDAVWGLSIRSSVVLSSGGWNQHCLNIGHNDEVASFCSVCGWKRKW